MVKTVLSPLLYTSRKTRSALLTSFFFFWVLLAACSPPTAREPETIQISGATMGTSYHITLVASADQPLDIDPAALQADVDAQLQLINQHMSTYIADSELMVLNAAAVGEWHYLSEPLRDVLAISEGVSRRSNGAFDITVGPLVDLWGFGPNRHDSVPSADEIAVLRSAIGYQHLELVGHQLRKASEVRMDLSAVAKGYGVDWVADYLLARGYRNLMVEIGGELRLHGVNARGTPWRIAVEQPETLQSSVRKAISLTDIAMATSGDYRNYFEKDGKRFSHTINPASGYPIDHRLASVTVLAATCAEADAWATALNVLGPDEGMTLAEREGLAVYMIVKTDEGFVDFYSSAFDPYK